MVSLFELHSRSGKGGTPCPSPIDERNVTKGKKLALKRLRKGGKKQVEEAGGSRNLRVIQNRTTAWAVTRTTSYSKGVLPPCQMYQLSKRTVCYILPHDRQKRLDNPADVREYNSGKID